MINTEILFTTKQVCPPASAPSSQGSRAGHGKEPVSELCIVVGVQLENRRKVG